MTLRTLPLLVLAIFVASDCALAARPAGRRLRNCSQNCVKSRPAESYSQTPEERTGTPRYCLARMYLNYPGAYDLWECLVYPNGCDDPTGLEEDLYYGFPTQGLPPESCPNCESDSWGYGIGSLPPHKYLPLDAALAWKILDAGLSAAGNGVSQSQSEIHRIDARNVPADILPNRPIDFIMVPVPFPVTSATRYIGMEIDPQAGSIDTIGSPRHIRKGTGQALNFDYTSGGESRTVFIWLQR